MSVGEYTPTTDDVRHAYVSARSEEEFAASYLSQFEPEFDRWLDGVIREANAEALEEAADAMGADPSFRDPLRLKSDWLRARAARILEERLGEQRPGEEPAR